MKKLLAIGCLIFGFAFLISSNVHAQSGLDFKAGLAYGSEIEAIGIQAGAVYGFTERLSGAADFTYYFPDSYDFYAFNANVHYNFYREEGTDIYGLAGLNYATQKVDFNQFSASNSEAGLNLGGGANFGLDFVNLFAELKYVISNYDQLVLSAGLRFNL